MPFKKGNQLRKGIGRGVGADNKMSAEAKDVLARAYLELGGFEGFVKCCRSSQEHMDWFYTRMWIRLLPMQIRVEHKEDIIYKSYHEVSVALADHGISLDSIQKLKEIEFKPPERKGDD